MTYEHLTRQVRMSDYGYWIVTVNVAPGRYVSVMIAVTGISPAEAQELALAVTGAPVRGLTPCT